MTTPATPDATPGTAPAITPDALAPEVKDALRRLIFTLADSKRVLGIRYSDWLLGAPSIEMGIAASAMAQDEWGHARLLYALLKDFELDPVEVEHTRDAEAYCSVGCLDEPLEDWACFVAAVVVVDGALAVALEALMEGGYEPSAGRIAKMLAEEEFHADLGSAWFKRLAAGSDEARTRLRGATEDMLPDVLRCFAPEDATAGVLSDAGLMPEAAELRERFVARTGALLARVDVDPSAAASAADATGEAWDEQRGRAAGRPDEETVARARGDLNRALFVE
jgi:ring-1,2-phenylacetyl-CoA epoxidase subunit PaaC